MVACLSNRISHCRARLSRDARQPGGGQQDGAERRFSSKLQAQPAVLSGAGPLAQQLMCVHI